MRHMIFEQADHYTVALLIKPTGFKLQELLDNYVIPLETKGLQRNQVIGFTLDYPSAKPSAKEMKAYLDNLLPALDSLGITHLLVADAGYFKTLVKKTRADPHFGYPLPCTIKGYEHMTVVLSVNHQALIYNPVLQSKLDMSLDTLSTALQGTYEALGSNIIHSAQYPQTLPDIAAALNQLHQFPLLTCDIETFSLRMNKAGIGSIAFAWDEHNGMAFLCDWTTNESHIDHDGNLMPGFGAYKATVLKRELIRQFFETYQGKVIWHNATFDLKILVYTLWMDTPLDTHGLLKGLEIMTRHFEDTKIIAYLATNSTAGNILSLKHLAHEFAGNWAVEEINDIRLIEPDALLTYNLVDALSTWYVYKKYRPILIKEHQLDLYESLMLPSIKTLIQIELTGMPMSDSEIQRVKAELEATAAKHLELITQSPIIKLLNVLVQTQKMEAANSKLKTKQHPLEKFADVVFNPNSGPQLQQLLYEQMGLPILDYTTKKQPATGAGTLEKLINHTDNPDYKAILEALIGYGKVSKILSTFIPAFENGMIKADGRRYLHGSFNLGGTVSGRLSSSDPNLQNLPAGSTYGKLIKECFVGPEGWLFVGADFASLEDRINALLTQDPAKLRVYTDGYDGHSLRAYAYFGDQMPDIVNTVESINSIGDKYPHLRQESKSPTFALTYQGTWMTMVKNLGWSEEKAKAVEANYHKLYAVSTQWVKQRIEEAAKKGYAEAAFGLRIRTPLLAQSLMGTRQTLREAEAEARTLGNAISGQSYGLLTNRAVNAFMKKVWDSPYKYDIKPVALIHDAIYLMIRDDADVVAWVNKHLTEEMAWQGLPEIKHDQVKLGAELDIFWPSWANGISLPATATKSDIITICSEAKNTFFNKAA